VKYLPPGTISVAQIDPIWEVKTDCGGNYTSKKQVSVNDTFKYKILILKKGE